MNKATYLLHMGEDMDVADAARVSFAKKAANYSEEGNERLIKFLAREGHIAPFGHNYLRFHVKTPVFVARQLVKHKFMRMSEVSRRYVKSDPEFYTPTEWRAAADDVKQGSVGVSKSQYFPTSYLGQTQTEAVARYRKMIDQGVCAEQARMILPLNMFTEFWWSGSLDAFSDMCNLRCKPDSQFETRVIAQQISSQIRTLFPIAWAALVDPDPLTSIKEGI
jgi:thymidylate synthase (FAD)